MYIDYESVYSSSSAVKQTSETLQKKIIWYLCFISVGFIHSCHHRLKKRNFILEKDFGQSIWPAGDQQTTAFTILNCLEYEFLKGFLVQVRKQSLWKFSILSNILDLQWCLPNKWKIHSQLSAMFTCRDAKGGELSSQASKMLYSPPGAVNIASYKEPLDQSDCRKLFVQLWNYTNEHYSSPTEWIMRKPNKNKMAGANSRFVSVSESIFNCFLLKMLLRSLSVYILKQLFFSISVNSGRIFTSISKNNC